MSLEPNAEKKIVKITQRARAASRVVVVDRDSMSSDLLASVLTRDSRWEAAAIQPNDLLRAVATNEVDVVVIGAGVSSESGNGFDLANAVSRARPNVYIVILLNETTHEMVIDAFRSGARGVFSRQQPMTDFLDCVEHVRRGFLWAGTEGASCLLEAFKSIPAPNLLKASNAPTLTARELQVVQCAATGKTNKTIATELSLSEHTVKNYLFRAFEKLGVSSRVELLFYLTIRGHTFNSKGLEGSQADINIE